MEKVIIGIFGFMFIILALFFIYLALPFEHKKAEGKS